MCGATSASAFATGTTVGANEDASATATATASASAATEAVTRRRRPAEHVSDGATIIARSERGQRGAATSANENVQVEEGC